MSLERTLHHVSSRNEESFRLVSNSIIGNTPHPRIDRQLHAHYLNQFSFALKVPLSCGAYMSFNGNQKDSRAIPSGPSVYSEHTLLTVGWQKITTQTSLSPCGSSSVHSLHSSTLTEVECCCTLDASPLYSEGSYVAVYFLQSMHLFKLIEIILL